MLLDSAVVYESGALKVRTRGDDVARYRYRPAGHVSRQRDAVGSANLGDSVGTGARHWFQTPLRRHACMLEL
jgi:hypothetical protein